MGYARTRISVFLGLRIHCCPRVHFWSKCSHSVVWFYADGEGQNHLFGSSAEEVSEALTMTTFLDMLNDAPRNRAYRLAIQKAVKGAHHVLDIGYALLSNHSKLVVQRMRLKVFLYFDALLASQCQGTSL